MSGGLTASYFAAGDRAAAQELEIIPMENPAQGEAEAAYPTFTPEDIRSFKNSKGVETCKTGLSLPVIGLDVGCTILQATAWVGMIAIKVFSAILWLAVQLFNLSANLTLNGSNFTTERVPLLAIGWTIIRDLANISFIFILLLIAISTILGIEGYGVKKLLPKVIVAAVLINFSLVICRVIIDLSNLLALQFWNAFPGGDIKTVLGNGLNPQWLLRVTDNFTAGGSIETLGKIIVASVLGSILILIAAFVIFAGVVYFIIRLIALWFLMIFSPIAFIGPVLPQTANYARDWWKKLMEQAFFAPAYLFFLYLVGAVVNRGFLKTTGSNSLVSVPSAATGEIISQIQGGTFVDDFNFVFQYIILAVLLLASLVVAKQLSVAGGGFALDQASSFGKKALGGISGFAGRTGLRYTAPRAERWARGEGLGGVISKIPVLGGFATRGFMKYAEAGRAPVADWEKRHDPATNESLKKRATQFGVSQEELAAIINLLTKREDLRSDERIGFGNATIKKGIGFQKQLGLGKEAVGAERLRPDIAIESIPENMKDLKRRYSTEEMDRVKEEMGRLKQKGEYRGLADEAIIEKIIEKEEIIKIARRIRPEDVPKLASSLFQNEKFIGALKKVAGPAIIQKISERGDAKKFFDELATKSKIPGKVPEKYGSIEEMVEALRKEGNFGAASWAANKLMSEPILRQVLEKETEEAEGLARIASLIGAKNHQEASQAAKNIQPQDIPKIDVSLTANNNFSEFVKTVLDNKDPRYLEELAKRNDDLSKMVLEEIKKEVPTVLGEENYIVGDKEKAENIAKVLLARGNKEMADWFTSKIAKDLFNLK